MKTISSSSYESDDHGHEDLPNLSPPYQHHSSSTDHNSCSCKSRRKIKLKVRQKNANKRLRDRSNKSFNNSRISDSKGPNDDMGDGIQNETHLFNKAELEVTSKSNKDVVRTANDDREAAFVDEEELFNMHVLMDSMAEGLLLTPPAMRYNWDDDDDYDDDSAMDLTLWRL